MISKYEHQFFDYVFHYKTTNSTSLSAEKLIKQGEQLGNFLIIADKQISGKGRRRNRWFSPAGGLWITMALNGLNVQSNLTIFTGIILRRTIAELYPEISDRLKIKWPNDIFIDDKKISGILSSYLSYNKYHLIGIGIDTNITELPNEISEIATSLAIELQKNIENVMILQRFIDIFSETLSQFLTSGLQPFLNEYLDNSYLMGKKISIGSDFEEYTGTVERINKKGAIILRLENNMLQPFYSGTIKKIF